MPSEVLKSNNYVYYILTPLAAIFIYFTYLFSHWGLNYSLATNNLKYLVFLIAPNLVMSLFLLATTKLRLKKIVPLSFILSFLMTLLFSYDLTLQIKLLILSFLFFTTIYGYDLILQNLIFTYKNVPKHLRLLTVLSLLQFILFFTSLFKFLNGITWLIIILVPILKILFSFFRKNNPKLSLDFNFKTFSFSRMNEILRTEFILCCVIYLILMSCWIIVSLPQTYADGVVSHLPLIKDFIKNTGLPFHNYNWGRLVPQSYHILSTGPYLLAGEQGSALFTLFHFVFLIYILYKELIDKGVSLKNTLFFLSLICTLSPVVIFATNIYLDIPATTFSIASFFLIMKSLESPTSENNFIFVFLGCLMAAISISTKLTSLLYVAVTLMVFVLINSSKIISKVYIRHLLISGAIAGIMISPWFIRTYLETGNPFFPIFNSLFNTKINLTSMFTESVATQFNSNNIFIEIIKLPLSLTYQTSTYGEYLDHSTGFFIIFFYFLFIVSLFNHNKINHKNLLIYILPFFIYLPISKIISKLLYFRYWYSAFIILLFGMALRIYSNFNSKSAKSIDWFIKLISASSIVFYFGYSIKNNFHLSDGTGFDLFFNNNKKQAYFSIIYDGVPDFIKTNTSPQDCVLSSGFEFVNQLDRCTYYFQSPNLLFWGDQKNISSHIKNNSVKYWIISKYNLSSEIKNYSLYKSVLEKPPSYEGKYYLIYQIN